MRKCIKCGADIKDSAKFCDECGTEQTNKLVEQSNLNINTENEKSEYTSINEIANEVNEVVNTTANKHKIAIIISIIAIAIVLLLVIINANKKPNNMTQRVYDIGIDLLEDVDLCLEKKMSIDRLTSKVSSAYDRIVEYRESDTYPKDEDTLGDLSLEMLCSRMMPNEFRTNQSKIKIELYQVEEFRKDLKKVLKN